MNNKIAAIIETEFSSFTRKYSFHKEKDEYTGDDFSILYSSSFFYLRMQTYHREIYLYSFPPFDVDKESAIYNVILYQKREKHFEWPYFHEVDDIEECYRLQIDNLVTMLSENLSIIQEFYLHDGFYDRYNKLKNYVISLSPSTFATVPYRTANKHRKDENAK
jgi:hypothetical protein